MTLWQADWFHFHPMEVPLFGPIVSLRPVNPEPATPRTSPYTITCYTIRQGNEDQAVIVCTTVSMSFAPWTCSTGRASNSGAVPDGWDPEDTSMARIAYSDILFLRCDNFTDSCFFVGRKLTIPWQPADTTNSGAVGSTIINKAVISIRAPQGSVKAIWRVRRPLLLGVLVRQPMKINCRYPDNKVTTLRKVTRKTSWSLSSRIVPELHPAISIIPTCINL
ncbi:uncharacterized protein LY89DRAFT_108426 [Mollisia scopiformis]|uniref:Uncharacterized protein n=1 Tax=Mollisia scopiformis TaxID=149040 RepID=A0A194X5E4_MOLSC|nr:uncharacterized protein LY89DRAFT_108426 [Mollisia scopiformis]KUJ15294.1 hypothetical protein LY89DRAFT_108426 [Mollisia scopiformis]